MCSLLTTYSSYVHSFMAYVRSYMQFNLIARLLKHPWVMAEFMYVASKLFTHLIARYVAENVWLHLSNSLFQYRLTANKL